MSKLFVDEIRELGRKNLIGPSPDAYKSPETFGKIGLKLKRSGLKVDDMHNYYLNE